MSKIIVPIEMPETCLDCPFRMGTAEVHVGDGLYKKISCCRFAPEEIEDPWRSIYWQRDNREDWCPLESVEENSVFTLEPRF